MKTFTTTTLALSALASLFFGVSAQDESGAHDGLLPLTTFALTNAGGSTTGSQTLFATAITTSTIAGGLTTIYSDLSGVVTGTSTVPSTSVPTTSVTSILPSGTAGSLPGTTVLSGAQQSATSTRGVKSASVSTSRSASASGTKSSASTSASSSSPASASGSSAGGRIVAGGLGAMSAIVAGLIVL